MRVAAVWSGVASLATAEHTGTGPCCNEDVAKVALTVARASDAKTAALTAPIRDTARTMEAGPSEVAPYGITYPTPEACQASVAASPTCRGTLLASHLV